MLTLAAFLLAGDIAMNKIYERYAGTTMKAGFRFNVLLGFLSALIFWVMGGFSFHVTPFSILMAGVIASLGMSYNLLGFRILKSGSMALYSLFLMTGGMAVPYVWGLLALDEPFSPLRTAGLALLILAVILSNLPKRGQRVRAGLILICVVVFLLNGCVSVLSKTHQIEASLATVTPMEFVMLMGLFKFVSGSIAYGIVAKKEGKAPKTEASGGRWYVYVLIALLSAAIGGLSFVLQLKGAVNQPATVLYPFITGGSMIFSTAIGILAFREKPSRRLLISIGLCFVGTLMFL